MIIISVVGMKCFMSVKRSRLVRSLISFIRQHANLHVQESFFKPYFARFLNNTHTHWFLLWCFNFIKNDIGKKWIYSSIHTHARMRARTNARARACVRVRAFVRTHAYTKLIKLYPCCGLLSNCNDARLKSTDCVCSKTPHPVGFILLLSLL
jgi:hypothetical protein